ncbi:hypothetical protein HYALB_00008552 [Hymenoscyphus albidus]|uniref:Uncharacterized protein n=1 Tax=Hymenoscyphus albidus TaxID=595503 RepID=A0A9N9LH93_9HELO|nr:hypothetical protein HYALB_00008552 [Hymenoscyphus albidus]
MLYTASTHFKLFQGPQLNRYSYLPRLSKFSTHQVTNLRALGIESTGTKTDRTNRASVDLAVSYNTKRTCGELETFGPTEISIDLKALGIEDRSHYVLFQSFWSTCLLGSAYFGYALLGLHLRWVLWTLATPHFTILHL